MAKTNKAITLNDAKEKIDEMVTSFSNHFVELHIDKEGNRTKIVNPMAIKSYFFSYQQTDKSSQPIYPLEQMEFFFNVFVYAIEQINLYIYPFAADIKDFCKMVNISNEELLKYKNNGDPEMKALVEKLYDYCRDSNLTLAQNKIYNSTITNLKAKSELEIVEKKAPNVNVNVQAKVPLEMINERLAIIRNYEKKAIDSKDE